MGGCFDCVDVRRDRLQERKINEDLVRIPEPDGRGIFRWIVVPGAILR